MRTTWQDLVVADGPIVADGGMGTMLFSMGLERGACPELWNVERPDDVRSIHREYIQAGAQIILTNSFGGNRYRLAMHDQADRAAELNVAAARVARSAADAADKPVAVGGSMGPTGQLLVPIGTLPFEDAAAAFEEQARALVAGGVDVLWIETMSDLEEVRAAVEGCHRAAVSVPVVTTMTFDTRGRTMMGVKPEQAVEALQAFDVAALGANCGNGPDELETAVGKMHAAGSLVPLVAKANAGLPHMEDGVAVYDASPAMMAEYAVRARDLGAQIIGACCGSTPDHIRAITQALSGN